MKPLFIFICCCLPLWVWAQEYPRREPDLERIADELYGARGQDLDYEALYENLAQLLSSPLNINQATAEELRFINILTEAQIQNIISYRATHGPLLSVYELQAVPGLDAASLYKLAPFVVVQPLWQRQQGRPVFSTTDSYILFRYEQSLERPAGFSTTEAGNRFQGSPGKQYLRMRVQNNQGFQAGLTAENDAGEAFAWKPAAYRLGFDHLSAYAQVTKKGCLHNLIAGDYQVQFGQGLMFGGILGMGKGSETITAVRQSNLGFVPYTSAYEAGYRRGAAATVALSKGIYVNSFFSLIRRDATVAADSIAASITTFQVNGFHRNARELATRKKTAEQDFGTVIQYKNARWDTGVLFDYLRFAAPVHKRESAYNQFAFSGATNVNTGVYVNYTVDNLVFFSELAHTLQHGWAGTTGALVSLTPKLDVAIVYRRFASTFHSQYGGAFAESTTPQNETGTYWGWKYSFSKKIGASGYVDLFRFPWLKYRVYAPSSGHEWLVRLNYQPTKQLTAFIQVREERKARNATGNTNLYMVSQTLKRNYRASIEYGPPALKLKSQVQFCTFDTGGRGSSGSALIQDVRIKAGRLRCTARYALFDTDDYDTRLYAYENDVWLAYSLPAYAGKGVRRYIMLEYALNRRLTVWLRYAQTRYTDRDETGTGLDRTDGNVRNDIKFEVRATL